MGISFQDSEDLGQQNTILSVISFYLGFVKMILDYFWDRAAGCLAFSWFRQLCSSSRVLYTKHRKMSNISNIKIVLCCSQSFLWILFTFLIIFCFQRTEHCQHFKVSADFSHVELSLLGVVVMTVIIVTLSEDLQDVVDHFLSIWCLVSAGELTPQLLSLSI